MTPSTPGSSDRTRRGKYRRFSPWTLLIALSLIVIGVSMLLPSTTGRLILSGEAFGTQWHVKIDHDTDSTPAIADRINRTLSQIDAMCSTWRSDSQLMRFNTQQSNEPFEVSSALAQLIDHARQIAQQTGGAFDPTVGSLTRYWVVGELPNDLHAREPTAHLGLDKYSVSQHPPALRKFDSEVQLDLSAIAKGYAVDQLYELIRNTPHASGGIIEIGGEVRVWGDTSHAIAIETPIVDHRGVMTVVELKNQALATSGDYRQQREIEGQTVTHIVDPRTGRSIGASLASVSVVNESCATADALATALMVMGPGEGYDFCVKHDIAAMFVARENDAFQVKRTPAWERDVNERGAMPRR